MPVHHVSQSDLGGPLDLPLERHVVASLLETATPVLVRDADHIWAANAPAATLLCAPSAGSLRGRALADFHCDEAQHALEEHRHPAARCWQTCDGRTIDLITADLPLGTSEHGWVLSTLLDVTDARRAREALFDAEARLRESQRLAQIGHWVLDLRTGVLDWSDEVFRFFEVERSAFAPTYEAFLSFVHPQDRERVDAAYRESVETQSAYDVTHRILLPNGRVKFARERGRTFFAADGVAIRSIGTVQDVTGETEREEQLRTAEHALASSCAGIAFADLDGGVRSVNPAFVQLWQLREPEAAKGRKLAEFCADPAATARIIAELSENSSSVGNLVGLRADGSTFVAQYVASVARAPSGHPLGMLVHFLDVTERITSERSLRESEERLKLVFDHSSDLIALLRVTDEGSVVEMANERMLAAFREIAALAGGAVSADLTRTTLLAALGYAADSDAPLVRALRDAVEQTRPIRIHATIAALSRLFACSLVPVIDSSGVVGRVLVTLHDITAETVAETTLVSTQALLLQAERLANMGSWQRDLATDVSRWSPGMFRLLGFDPESSEAPTDEVVLTRIHPDDRARAREFFARNLAGRPVGEFEWRVILGSGIERSIRGSAQGLVDVNERVSGVIGFLQDITDEREAAQRIRRQLDEKEVLLREIHHRVKNNLQIISSLLYLQGHSVDDARLSIELEATRGRIAALALVHEKLYSADDLGSVDIGLYARDLGLSLFAVFGTDPARVALIVEEPAFRIELDRAIPCGLVVNELLTNALKHAFAEDRSGTIRIAFPCTAEQLVIVVEDDGVGAAMPGRVSNSGLGLRLLPRLAAQLGGTLEWSTAAGTRAVLSFPRTR